MFYADDAGVTSRTPEGLARVMAVIVTTCQEFGLMVSESKTETMRLWSVPSSTEITLDIKAAGQRYKQTEKIVYLGGATTADAKMSIEINRRISAAGARIQKYSSQLYDRPNAELSLKVRLLKAEVIETCCMDVPRGHYARGLRQSADCASQALAASGWIPQERSQWIQASLVQNGA